LLVSSEIGAKSRSGLNGRFPNTARIGDERAAEHKQERVAVGSGFCDRFGAEIAAGTEAVLNDDRLLEVGAQLVAETAPDEVKRAAGCQWYNQLYRLRGIRLCGCRGAQCNGK